MTTAEKGGTSSGPEHEPDTRRYDLKTIQLLQHAAALGLTREEILGIPADGPSNIASLDDRRRLHQDAAQLAGPTEQTVVRTEGTPPVSGEIA